MFKVYVFFQGPLVRWLKVNFGEAFIAWIHVKALRVFVESVLRYLLFVLILTDAVSVSLCCTSTLPKSL